LPSLIRQSVLENPLAEPVHDDFVETVRTRDGSPAGFRTAEKPSDLASGGSILSSGRCRAVEAHPVERKLAAIFSADVEGYVGLMGRDEVVREVP
jgi:hypothetical protein